MPDQPPTVETILKDREFHNLPVESRMKVLGRIDPEFSRLDPNQQKIVISKAQTKLYDTMLHAPEKDAEKGFGEHALGVAKGLYHSTIGGLADFGKGIGTNPAGTVLGLGLNQAAQFAKANKATSPSEKAGYTAAGLLPIVGPAAAGAGEKIGEGKTGEGVGEALGLIAPMSSHNLYSLSEKPIDKTVEGLKSSANKTYAKVLDPKRDVNKKLTSERIAPEAVKRGIVAPTFRSLGKKVSAGLEKANAAREATVKQVAPSAPPVDVKPIFDRLDKLEQANSVNGVPQNKGRANAIKALRKQMTETVEKDPTNASKTQQVQVGTKPSSIIGPNGQPVQVPVYKTVSTAMQQPELSFESLHRARQLVDEQVGDQHVLMSNKGKVKMQKATADAMRKALSDASRPYARANAEYAFWKNFDRVWQATEQRRAGQKGNFTGRLVSGAVAAGELARHASPLEALLGYAGARTLSEITNNTGWRTVSAITKDRLADAISSGDSKTANVIIKSLSGISQTGHSNAERERQEALSRNPSGGR